MPGQDLNDGKSCPLCLIPDKEVLIEFSRWKLARTKTMKGHKERLMLLHKEHVKDLDEQSVGEAYMLLLTMGLKLFSYANKWAVFEPVYATVPSHWHRVASDLDPKAEDHEQILKTPRLVIARDTISVTRIVPDSVTQPVELRLSNNRPANKVSKVDIAEQRTTGTV